MHVGVCKEPTRVQVEHKELKTVDEQEFVRNDIETYEEKVISRYNPESYEEEEIYDYDTVPYEEVRTESRKIGTRQESYIERVSKMVEESYFDREPYDVSYIEYVDDRRSRQVSDSRWDGRNWVNTWRTEYYTERVPVYKKRTEYKQVQKYRKVPKYEDVTKYKTVDVYGNFPVTEIKYTKVPKYRTVTKVRQVPVYETVSKTRPKPVYRTVTVQKEVSEMIWQDAICNCSDFVINMTPIVCICYRCTCGNCDGRYDLSGCVCYAWKWLVGLAYLTTVACFIPAILTHFDIIGYKN